VFLIVASKPREHALLVEFPVSSVDHGGPVEPPPLYSITLNETGQLRVNGKPMHAAELEAFLDVVRTVRPRPEIVFEPDANASYEASLQSLGLIWKAGLVDPLFCFGGLEKHRDFARSHGANLLQPQADSVASALQPVIPQGCTPIPLYEAR
jgi:biopolymer transport protein ExbD